MKKKHRKISLVIMPRQQKRADLFLMFPGHCKCDDMRFMRFPLLNFPGMRTSGTF